jgi:hypothetical protein
VSKFPEQDLPVWQAVAHGLEENQLPINRNRARQGCRQETSSCQEEIRSQREGQSEVNGIGRCVPKKEN